MHGRLTQQDKHVLARLAHDRERVPGPISDKECKQLPRLQCATLKEVSIY